MLRLSKLKFLSNQDIRQVLFGSGVTLLFKLVGASLSFIVTVLITRLVDIYDVGIYFLNFTLLILFATLARLGMDNALLRYVGDAYESNDFALVSNLYKRAIQWVLISSLILGIALYYSSGFIAHVIFKKPELEPLISFMGLGIMPIAIYNVHVTIFQATGKAMVGAISSAVIIPLAMILLLLVMQLYSSITALDLFFYYCLSSFINCLCCYWIYRKMPTHGVGKVISPKIFWKSSLVMLSIIMIDYLVLHIPQLFAGYHLEAGAVALLAVCIRITNLINFIMTSVSRIMAPKLAFFSSNGDLESIKNLVAVVSYASLAVSLTVCLTLVYFSELVLTMFGEEYVVAKSVLISLAFAQIFLLYNGVGKMLLQMSQYELSAQRLTILHCIILTILVAVMAMSNHLVGIANAVLITSILAMCVTSVAVYRKLKINLFIPTIHFGRLS